MPEEVKRIVRLLSTDISGEIVIERALRKIKGISFMFSKAVCTAVGIDSRKKIGLMTIEEIKKIEDVVKNPSEFGVPSFMMNRRKDNETGKDIHVAGTLLEMKKTEDINLLKRMHAYRGERHALGQPVRGQRTRSSFRTQKSVGVVKKKAMAQKTGKEK
ncbi:MAG: 30S ribosomal protein S13 [Candidatus Aenigmatarchaeota archaeon]